MNALSTKVAKTLVAAFAAVSAQGCGVFHQQKMETTKLQQEGVQKCMQIADVRNTDGSQRPAIINSCSCSSNPPPSSAPYQQPTYLGAPYGAGYPGGYSGYPQRPYIYPYTTPYAP